MIVLLFDVILTLLISLSVSYLIFGRGTEIIIGTFPNQRVLDWDTLPLVVKDLRAKISNPQWPWAIANRSRMVMGLTALILSIGALPMAFNDRAGYVTTVLFFLPFALLPRLYYRQRENTRREVDAILPSIIVNLRALLADGSLPVATALMHAVADGDGPIFDEVRRDLNSLGVGLSLERALMQAADRYQRPSFTTFARVVVRHDGKPEELEPILAKLEEEILDEALLGVQDIINRRQNTLLVLGSLFLLPALLIILLAPALRDLLGGSF